jgi:hypothetical protein
MQESPLSLEDTAIKLPRVHPDPRVYPETISGSSAEASAEARLQAIVDRAVERAIAALIRNLPL